MVNHIFYQYHGVLERINTLLDKDILLEQSKKTDKEKLVQNKLSNIQENVDSFVAFHIEKMYSMGKSREEIIEKIQIDTNEMLQEFDAPWHDSVRCLSDMMLNYTEKKTTNKKNNKIYNKKMFIYITLGLVFFLIALLTLFHIYKSPQNQSDYNVLINGAIAYQKMENYDAGMVGYTFKKDGLKAIYKWPFKPSDKETELLLEYVNTNLKIRDYLVENGLICGNFKQASEMNSQEMLEYIKSLSPQIKKILATKNNSYENLSQIIANWYLYVYSCK